MTDQLQTQIDAPAPNGILGLKRPGFVLVPVGMMVVSAVAFAISWIVHHT